MVDEEACKVLGIIRNGNHDISALIFCVRKIMAIAVYCWNKPAGINRNLHAKIANL